MPAAKKVCSGDVMHCQIRIFDAVQPNVHVTNSQSRFPQSTFPPLCSSFPLQYYVCPLIGRFLGPRKKCLSRNPSYVLEDSLYLTQKYLIHRMLSSTIKKYFPNLLEITLLCQIFVFWVRDYLIIFWFSLIMQSFRKIGQQLY